MRKTRHNEEQIIGILKEAAAGVKIADLIRKHGISEQTFHRWRSKYGGMEVSEAKRLRLLEDENRRPEPEVVPLARRLTEEPQEGRLAVATALRRLPSCVGRGR